MPDPRIIREKYCATAPGYDELYREEQLEKYRLVLSKIRPQGSLADIGAGTCLFEEYLSGEGVIGKLSYIVALDLTDCMLFFCKRRVYNLGLGFLMDIVVAEATRLPLRDKSVDYAFAFTVFDLTDNVERAIEEMVRVTRVTGVYTLLKRAERRRLTSMCQIYIGETDKDVACLPRAFHNDEFEAGVIAQKG